MMEKNSLLSLLLVLIFWPILGQEQKQNSCSFEEAQQEYYEQNPEALKKAKEFEKIVQNQAQLKKDGLGKVAGNYIVPVVFHIYDAKYPDDADGNVRNVTDARVIQALKDINDDFKGFNDPVDNAFSNIEGGMNIEFRLAQVDPNGNTTTGIIYHERKEGFGLSSNDAEIAKYAWDNFKYMNVHVQEIIKSGSRNQSGIAWFPAQNMSEEGTARVVYNGKYMIYSPPASSLTHEFGHFLGLHHTFNGGCVSGADNGDKVLDTPPTTSGAATAPGSTCNTGVTNCFNNLINHQNHMDYNPCESMFTAGQVTRMESFMDHEARITLWEDANLIATGVKQADLGARVIFTFQKSDDSAVDQALAFIEGFANNNGDILNKKRIKAVSGAKFAVTGQMQEGVHFTTTGVPNGLNTKITVEDNENAYITFTGNAVNHSKADSKEIKITLLNPAIVGGVNSLYSKTGSYNIDFIDPYKPYYEMYSPAIVTGRSVQNYNDAIASKFNSLVIGGQFRTRLRSYDGNTVTIDNNAMEFDVLCNTGTINVTNLTEGTSISANSVGTWVGRQSVGTSPPRVAGAGYTSWHGRTGYAAIRVPTLTGDYVYGWLRLKVTSNGEYAELTTFALNPDPGKSIQAKVTVPNLVYSSDRFLESVKNDGTMGNEITVDVKDATLAVSGNLVSGTHYGVVNVPNGLTLQVKVINSRQLKLIMKGIATESDWAQQPNGFVKNIRLKFKSSVFSGGTGAQVAFKEFPLNVEYIGNAYSKVPNPIRRFTVGNTTDNGSVAVLPWLYNLEFTTASYQFQEYPASNSSNEFPGVKFVTWRKDAVANSNYELTRLSAGTVIGPNLSWKNGREYNEGRGQHMIDSETYRVWRGRTDYVGIRINRSGRMHYGWIKLKVGTNGRTYEILEYALQGIPEASIKAGTKDSDDVNTYCDANGTHGDEAITNVKFAGIDKSSARDASGYSDYTGNTAFVARGESYPLKVKVVGWNGGSAAKIHAWFDWNQDYDFNDSGEAVSVTKISNSDGEISINIPTNARLGVTRMRLRVDDRNSNLSCGTANTRGEVEDYQINIGIANASCTDGEQNGDETGIDCGGSSCAECVPDPTCDDGIRNGDETEVDCGGEFCEPCEIFTVHCDATATGDGEGIDINKVVFGTINNSSTGDAQYTDYSNVSTNLTRGEQVVLSVTTKNTWNPTTVGVWIDWNNDNDYRDDGERVLYIKDLGTGDYTSTVIVPNSAVGNTLLRMRVRSGYYQDILRPCGTITSIGEVEDYRVTVGGSATPTCTDGIQNGDETGVDCGGASCDPCTAEPTCTDGVQNGDETGVDCGGASCDPCQTVAYCASNSNNITGEYISKVVVGSINNTSTGSTGGYGDYTAISTSLAKGSSNTITITPTWAGSTYNEGYSVWIDYNKNGDFDDSGEQVFSKAASKDTPVSGSFTVPESAINGNTRMRVSMEYNKIPASCGTLAYGEVEDYTINITGGSSASCSDGVQNGNETGIDCGGSCTPCVDDGTVVYVDMTDVTISSSTTWSPFQIEIGDERYFGPWFSGNILRLVNYGKDVVCENTSDQVTLIDEGLEVGASSNFVANSNSFVISSSSYNNWNGKSGYIGFRFKIGSKTHYGWFYATVANNGLSYTIKDYAYNTAENQGLVTKRHGRIKGNVPENQLRLYPNPFNDMFTIDTSKLDDNRVTVVIYDMLGKVITRKNYDKNPGLISFGSGIIESGNYFVKIHTNTESEVVRIVKSSN